MLSLPRTIYIWPHVGCRYCAKVFGPPSEYVLLSTGGDASPPTPMIQEFNCVQEYLQQRLDHFSSSDSRRFKQMYWVSA